MNKSGGTNDSYRIYQNPSYTQANTVSDVCDSTRDTDIPEKYLRGLHDDRLVTPLPADPEQEGMPDVFWAVSDQGVSQLMDSGFWEEIKILSAADSALNRSQRLRDIETFDGLQIPNMGGFLLGLPSEREGGLKRLFWRAG
jgi:hypothetical protein